MLNKRWLLAAALWAVCGSARADGPQDNAADRVRPVPPPGIEIPAAEASHRPGTPYRHRLDVWLHGRGETLTELNFIDGRQRSPGEFAPPDTFVLHPYGRYCNANKFAGEIDLFEALEHVRRHYRIDENR